MKPPPDVRLPPERLPLLVTGVAGVAGYNAYHYFRDRYPGQVIGVRQRDNVELSAPDIVPCDAEDPLATAELFAGTRFGSVLDCAGNCALKACELDPALAYRINVEGVRNLLPHVRRDGLRFVHCSIDLVFSGLRDGGGYVETDEPDPVTVYGKSMVAAEHLIRDRYEAGCILRISLPMGVSFNGHAGAIDWIQSRFRKHRPATLYFDEIRTPTYTACLNRLFERMLAGDETGLFHTGGPLPLSLYQIAQVVNRVGGYDPHLLHGCPRVAAGPIPPRAGDVRMDSSKLTRTLGYAPFDPWPLDPAHVPRSRDWHFDRSTLPAGSFEQVASLLYRHPHRPDAYPPAQRTKHAHRRPASA